MSCHVLYCGNAQLSPTKILVSLAKFFLFTNFKFFLETNLIFQLVKVVF